MLSVRHYFLGTNQGILNCLISDGHMSSVCHYFTITDDVNIILNIIKHMSSKTIYESLHIVLDFIIAFDNEAYFMKLIC